MSNNNPFGNSIDTSIEQGGDILGGNAAVESDVYAGTITQVYAGESSGGAKSVTFHVKLENGRDYRETVYVTSGREKGQKNYYEKDGKKSPLPGFTQANDLALLSTGQDLASQTWEQKVVKLYDFDAKAELPKNVMVATSMLDKPIKLGILKSVVDQNTKDANGNYVPNGKTRDQNETDKVFHAQSGQTVSELTNSRDPSAPGTFIEGWLAKNKGNTRNKAKGASGTAGAPGQNRPVPTAGGDAPAAGGGKSLFG